MVDPSSIGQGAGSPVSPPIRTLCGESFRMPLPEGWVDRSVYCSGGPVVGGFQVSLAVTVEHQDQAQLLDSFVEIQMSQLAGQLDGFEREGDEPAEIDGRPARRCTFSWNPAGGVPLRQTQWFVQNGMTVLAVTATAPRERFVGIVGMLERIVTGIVLVKAAPSAQPPR